MTATLSAAEQVLVSTKLHVPSVRPGFVPRRELVARLAGDGAPRLVLVCAPAGWGKTTLLAAWHASDATERPFAWVSLDPSDDDPVRFWRYLIGALQRIEPDLGRAALASVGGAGPDLVEAVLPPLINDLAALPRELVLVLDDYHLVRSELIHASVTYLVRHVPPTVRIAIASRADPPLPLGRLRAAGELVEIRAAELCFSEAEAEALLNGSLELGLDGTDVALLRTRTEGWAAGLQLAGLSLQGQENRHAFVEAFAGDDRHIGDYLHELLADHPPALREFLMRTAILERMCAPLCDAVTGKTDAAARLEELQRANLFLVPLDTRGEWYRYHHLFRDLLRHELARAEPSATAELHRRAAAWHRDHGTADEAIAHATAAADYADAAELIARNWLPVWNLGQREMVAAWIDALPPDVARGDPRVCLARGWTSLFLGALDEVEPWVLAAERGTLPGPLYDGTASVEANASMLRAAHATFAGDVGRAIEHARQALALDPGDASPMRSVLRLELAAPLYYAGRLESSEELLLDAINPPPGVELADAFVYILAMLACTRLDGNDLAGADRWVAETEQLVAELHLDELPSVSMLHLVRGRLLEQRGEITAAAAEFRRSVELARRGGRRLELANALLLHSRLEHRRRDPVAARSLLREARDVLATCPDPATLGEALRQAERTLQLAPVRRAAAGQPADPELSERELVVLRLLASELSQREIGSELYVSRNTVKTHTRSIFRKLGVASRADAVARGRELGLI
jgi:LuxR family maltose regulon positive regulatory protein